MDTNMKFREKNSSEGRRSVVMVLGGIERMEGQLRRCVAERGLECQYHPGHMTSGCRRLEDAVRRSCCVLCCLRCNSHAACLAAKKLCRKYGVPLHFVPCMSISGIRKILETLEIKPC